jgi:hypothetical protein
VRNRYATIAAATPLVLALGYVVAALIVESPNALGHFPAVTIGVGMIAVVVCQLLVRRRPTLLGFAMPLAVLCPLAALGAWSAGVGHFGLELGDVSELREITHLRALEQAGLVCVGAATFMPSIVALASLHVRSVQLIRLGAIVQLAVWVGVVASVDIWALLYGALWIAGHPPTSFDPPAPIPLYERMSIATEALPALLRAFTTVSLAIVALRARGRSADE